MTVNYIWLAKFVVVVISVTVTDVCWGKYMFYSNKGLALRAALWAAVLPVCGCIMLFSYMDDWRFVVASMMGGFIGTYITVKRHKKE